MKFRVIDKLTGKEADTYEIALHEEWAKELCYCDMDGFAILEDGTLLLVDECGKFEYCDADRFEIVFDDEKPQVELIKDIRSMICKVNDYYGYTDSMLMFKVLFDQKYHGWVKRKEGNDND